MSGNSIEVVKSVTESEQKVWRFHQFGEQTTHLIAGGVAGTAAGLILCPIEVVKARLQSSQSLKFQSQYIQFCKQAGPSLTKWGQFRNLPVFQCYKDIVSKNGVRGLMKGLVPTLAGTAPNRALYFFTYQNFKLLMAPYFFPNHNGDDEEDDDKENEDFSLWNAFLFHGSTSCTASFFTISLTNPIWLIKTRLQLHEGPLSIIDCCKSVYNQYGILGFWRGVKASYLGIMDTAFYFIIYENLKRLCLLEGPYTGDSSNVVGSIKSGFSIFLMAVISKSISIPLFYPHEVLRTRLREPGTKYRTLVQTGRLIYREEGIRAFYKGMGVHFLRAIPNNFIVMVCYELTVSLLS